MLFYIFITFLVSGIWHGANYTFIVWGMLHGVFQIIEKAFGLQRVTATNCIVRLFRIILTLFIVNILWTIFRMPTIADAIGVIEHMVDGGTMLAMEHVAVLAFAIFILLYAEINEEFFDGRFSFMTNKSRVVRWVSYISLIAYIVLGGVLDNSQFIYVSF